MEHNKVKENIEKILALVEAKIPHYLSNPDDKNIGQGNVAVCIIDNTGQVYGKIFGDDMNRGRGSFRIAWQKASQVWITGIRTSKYEELVFSGKIDEWKFGILRPDFIGWEGGIPIHFDEKTMVAAAFSGFRGTSDVEIVRLAAAEVLGHPIQID